MVGCSNSPHRGGVGGQERVLTIGVSKCLFKARDNVLWICVAQYSYRVEKEDLSLLQHISKFTQHTYSFLFFVLLVDVNYH